MNKMIRSAMMMASVGAMLCIVGCGGNSPEKVALEQVEALIKGMGMPGCTAKVSKSEIKGDKGVVYVDILENGEKAGTEKIDVHMKDGKWVQGLTAEDRELEQAAEAVKHAAIWDREKFGRPDYKLKPGENSVSYGANIVKKEKKGDSIFVTVDFLANEEKYDTVEVEVKKQGDSWKPVFKK